MSIRCLGGQLTLQHMSILGGAGQRKGIGHSSGGFLKLGQHNFFFFSGIQEKTTLGEQGAALGQQGAGPPQLPSHIPPCPAGQEQPAFLFPPQHQDMMMSD